MIKEIYDFYNGKCCRQETGDSQRCGFMKNGCEKKKIEEVKTMFEYNARLGKTALF